MPRNDDVIAGAQRLILDLGCERSFEPPADAIPRDGVADFLGDCEAEPWADGVAGPAGRTCSGTFPHLDEKRRRRLTPAAANSEKFGTRLESWQDRNDSLQSRVRATAGPKRWTRLGRKALTALSATACKDLLTTGSQHAFAESVAALANKAARLICALHGSLRPSLSGRSPSGNNGEIVDIFPNLNKYASPGRKTPADFACLRNSRSYSERLRASQRTRPSDPEAGCPTGTLAAGDSIQSATRKVRCRIKVRTLAATSGRPHA